MIYFIGAYDENDQIAEVKIGTTRVSAESRAQALANETPLRLSVISTRAGGYFEEHCLHYDLRKSRIRGEWFRPTEEVLSAALSNPHSIFTKRTSQALWWLSDLASRGKDKAMARLVLRATDSADLPPDDALGWLVEQASAGCVPARFTLRAFL